MNKILKDSQDSYVTLLQGDTYAVKTWLKEHGAKYNRIYNWYFPHDVEVPEQLPAEVTPVKFETENLFDEDGNFITDERLLQLIIDSFRYPPSESAWVGKIGETMPLVLQYKNSRSICSQFGVTNVYTFVDANNNVFKSMTTRALPVEEDLWYTMSARIKNHQMYRNERQTMISYIKNVQLFVPEEYDNVKEEEEC